MTEITDRPAQSNRNEQCPDNKPSNTVVTTAVGYCRCAIFVAADRLWEQFLQHAEQYLSVPQFVSVVSAMAETGAGLEEVWFGQARTQHLIASSLPQAIPITQAFPQQ